MFHSALILAQEAIFVFFEGKRKLALLSKNLAFENALHRNARYLSMPLSDFFSRRNGKKQLRTDETVFLSAYIENG
jgi:hypothetical protein